MQLISDSLQTQSGDYRNAVVVDAREPRFWLKAASASTAATAAALQQQPDSHQQYSASLLQPKYAQVKQMNSKRSWSK